MADEWRERLRQAVEASPLGTTAISTRAGLNTSYLRKLLETEQAPNLRQLRAICDVLGVTISWIAEGRRGNEETDRIVEAYLSLPPHLRGMAVQMLEAAAKGADGDGDSQGKPVQ
ncbi:helix-turn-helix domain-containing protein [Acuticoccus mangrovi]|uniref:Helix-turn-helix transcriptional regulator n=1 Tax=Acuticoccus mangrovi TaxID=2796142 RepID=A0A934MD18_9HYPH|nr:helix-turn-helix transcriptional regulator [Acuticoccus mangrovi]MBJ3775857.1 helix-turn-helix transcriptional regulator [Acuticoccus mangrovi]